MRNSRGLGAIATLFVACSGDVPSESTLGEVDGALSSLAQRILGCERVSSTPSQSDWTLASGSSGALSSSSQHTEGSKSLGISNLGYAKIVSAPMDALGAVSSTLSFDVLEAIS
jgi:hypothetical protein